MYVLDEDFENNKINFYIDKYTKKTKKVFDVKYEEIISLENLLLAWKEFKRGKSKRQDVQEFEFKLMENSLDLHQDLKSKNYTHDKYKYFKVHDPKERDIHKASVRDRIVHHALYQKLYPLFDTLFIADSYSCRMNKGTHRARHRFRYFLNKESKNYTKPCYVLKCDIKKFFASIDHDFLLNILKSRIIDQEIVGLLENIINSFTSSLSTDKTSKNTGLPLGNLTSQLLVNIYMHEFDNYVKQGLKVKDYIRYADDFVFVSQDKAFLENILKQITIFLKCNLKLDLHPNKVFIKSAYSGVDFLGFVFFPYHTVLRTSTKIRILKKLHNNNFKKTSLISYLGLLGAGDCYNLKIHLESQALLNL